MYFINFGNICFVIWETQTLIGIYKTLIYYVTFSDYYIKINILVHTQEKSALFSIISYFQLT
jgi:hypothetical protein